MIVVFAIGFSRGHPKRLYAPIDKEGGFCGPVDDNNPNNKANRSHIVYYNITAITQGICVERCPTPNEFCVMTDGTLTNQSMSDCLTNDKSEYYIGNQDDVTGALDSALDIMSKIKDISTIDEAKQLLYSSGLTFIVVTDTIELMNRCIPNISFILEDLEQFDGLNNVLTAAVSDVKNCWGLFLATAGITLVIAFVVICCLQCFAKVITWCLIFAGVLLVVVIGIITLVYGANNYTNGLQSDKTSSYIFIGFGIGCLVAALILIIILIALRNRISLAASLVKVASEAIKGNMCLILVPVVYALIFIVGLVLILVTMVYFLSSLEIDPGDPETMSVRSIKIIKEDRYVVLFVVLCFWWMTFLIIGANQYTIAGAGAYHYFSRKGEKPLFPIARTLVTLVLHHLGSIAVGAFLIALVATVRTILLYIAQKVKKTKNEQLKCLIACLQCCLGCLQKCVEFIASRAYIMMAIQGKNFWVSAFDALTLLMANPLRTMLLTAISKFLIIMAEITVAGLSVLISFILLRPDLFKEGLVSPFPPVMYWWFISFICALIAFFLTWIIFQVYESLIDTLFFCFLYDEHMEEIGRENYTTYCPEDLKQYMTVVDTNAREDDESSCCCCCGGSSPSSTGGSGSGSESVASKPVDV